MLSENSEGTKADQGKDYQVAVEQSSEQQGKHFLYWPLQFLKVCIESLQHRIVLVQEKMRFLLLDTAKCSRLSGKNVCLLRLTHDVYLLNAMSRHPPEPMRHHYFICKVSLPKFHRTGVMPFSFLSSIFGDISNYNHLLC